MTAAPRAPHDGHLRLDQIAPGHAATITRVDGSPAIVRRLMELGLVPGTAVEVVRLAPLGDPVELRIRGTHLSVRRSEASHIHVARPGS